MRYRRRGFHYVGNLAAKLADLQGFATLAQELIQNADDVVDATWLRFDVTSDALVVDNDGVFRSCGDLDAYDCPWLQDRGRGRRCDFHRFAWIGGGDKRLEADTIGAFGIGFLTVYQVTDVPELISAGQHWILNELADSDDQRIQMCEGCERCRADGRPGTRFILPWAREADSPLRQALRAQPFRPGDEQELVEALRDLLPGAMLFLRHLERIELAVDGRTVVDLKRYSEGQDVLVQAGTDVRSWRRFTWYFSAEADALRARNPEKIEPTRTAEVIVAFSDQPNEGRLFAWLPTQESTGLPCHVHADFFPTNDRKHLLWESDYRSAWNRVALEAAAHAISAQLDGIRAYIGHVSFWQLCQAARDLAEGPREPFRCFWRVLLPAIRNSACVYTQNSNWVHPPEATIVDAAFRDCANAIDGLGIIQVHEDLDFARNILTDRTNGLAVKALRLSVVNDRLRAFGVVSGAPPDDCPSLLREAELRRELWVVVERMLGSTQASAKEDRDGLARLPVVIGTDGLVWSPADVYRADDETLNLFANLGIGLALLAVDPEFHQLSQLSPALSVEAVVASLEQASPWADGAALGLARERVKLLEWLASRRTSLERRNDLKARIAALPLFPAGEGFSSLAQLSLPGAFEDPLGVAEVVDVVRVRALVPFLEDLGARTLSLAEYVKRHVPRALTDRLTQADTKRALVALLADRLGEFRDDQECQRILGNVPLVECRDGTFAKPGEVYFDTPVLRQLSLRGARVVATPAPDREQAISALFEWLGVEREPRLSDLQELIKSATGDPPTPSSRSVVQLIFEHLGLRMADAEELPPQLGNLVHVKWLPAQGNAARWFAPRELAAAYNQQLFATQAAFLDLDLDVQRRCAKFIELLGVQTFPTVAQVVGHLRQCASAGIPVSDSVYLRLSEERWSQDSALAVLVDTKCICLPGRGYVLPRHVFWTEHGFGKYRFRLSEALRTCGRFLDRVGVRQTPEPADAIEALTDIGADQDLRGCVLNDETRAIVDHCWLVLAEATRNGRLELNRLHVLEDKAVVPDARGMLNRPQVLFFEDRPNLAAHFRDSLGSNVIPLPELTAAVMEAAGVRRLSRHTTPELLECELRTESVWLQARCLERRELLRRLASAAGFASAEGNEWSHLDDLRFEAATSLLVRYACDALGRVKYSAPQVSRAIFLQKEGTLIAAFVDGRVSWPDIARELSLVVYPQLEPGRVAAALLQALVLESIDEVAEVLDALGVPRMAAAPVPAVQTEEPIDVIGAGGTTPPVVTPPAPVPEPPPLVVHPPPPVPPVRKPRSRYVTYVNPEDPTPDPAGKGSASANRETEEAGIRRVRWAEESAGRVVRVMPPNHPGYDIESGPSADEVERYIEVKSLGGLWGTDGVGLTATEFRTARELGDRYWLYVVERATCDDPCIYRVQDPARKANWFFFDHGWSEAAEP